MAQVITVQDRRGNSYPLTIGLTSESLLYVPTSENAKTGNIPQQFIGATREESLSTCGCCILRQQRLCYAQNGTPALAHISTIKATQRGRNRSLDRALDEMSPEAQAFRGAAIGDPGSIHPNTFRAHDRTIRRRQLAHLLYSHQWYLPHAQFLRGKALASCDTRQDVIDALAHGWRTAIHIPPGDTATLGVDVATQPTGTANLDGTPARYVLCPAQRQDKQTTCNQCRLCDATRVPNLDVVVFIQHGAQMTSYHKRQAAQAAQETSHA